MNDWRRIESAPKDGTQVLLVGGSGMLKPKTTYITGAYLPVKTAWCDDQGSRLSEMGFTPTHWMPLPEAPND